LSEAFKGWMVERERERERRRGTRRKRTHVLTSLISQRWQLRLKRV
jgi:hypothetical protein